MFDFAKLHFRRNSQTSWAGVLVLVVVIWSALVAGSLAWDMRQQQQRIMDTAAAAARANINKDLIFRNWATTHGGVYVSPTEHTPPNPYLKVPERDVVTTTGKMLTLMNPAYMLREMQSDFPGEDGTKSHLTSLKLFNQINAPDAWETKALHAFEQGGKEMLEVQQIDGQPYMRMMRPLVIEKGCLKCHAQQGYKLGDIRGGISSSVSLAPFLARERGFGTDIALSHIAIWLVGLAGLVWLGVSFRRVQRLEILVRSAAAAEVSERRFRAVTDSANDAIVSVDSAGNIMGWNAAAERLFGYTEAEAMGQSLTVLMPERFRKQHSAGVARIMACGNPHLLKKTMEVIGLRKDGSEFPHELSLAQWQTAEGQFFTATIRDITERKQAEEKIHKLNEELETKVQERTKQLLGAQEELLRKEKLAVLGQVAGSVGHELRNPLGVMSNAVYFLQTVLTDADETTKEYLGIIKNEIAASERIVSDLLDSVRIKPPQPEAVSVAELIAQTLRKCSVPSSVTVQQVIPATLSPLRVDALQIHQVLRNLISNGVEAMADGGTLEIRAVENVPAKTITIIVKDSGSGMTPEQLGHLFQPLFTTKARGIGLGLVVVKNLTEANGGAVKVQSEVAHGTTFTVTLPSVNSAIETA